MSSRGILRRQPSPPSPPSPLMPPQLRRGRPRIGAASSATNEVEAGVTVIDSMLETRPQFPQDYDATAPSEPTMPPPSEPAEEVVSSPGPVLDQRLPGRTLAPGDVTSAHLDVYGRPPPAITRREERIAALEAEVRLLPTERKRSLLKALRHSPLLYVSSAHAKLIVEDEYFEPGDAARRLANYWERREGMFGSRAFSEGVFTAASYDDYLRYYDKCRRIASDPDADSDEKHLSSMYLETIHRIKIMAMDDAIDSASPDDLGPLLEARRRCPELAASDDHKLLFLQSENFVETFAAERMVRYWKARRMFFGPDLAFASKLTLDDMEDHIFEYENYMSFRLMPKPDEHGRTVMACNACDFLQEGWTEHGLAKYIWYILEAALEREECRSNGLVILGDYRVTEERYLQRISNYRKIVRTVFFQCVPVRIRAIHVCFRPDSWWRRLFTTAFAALAAAVANRAIIHAGTDEENVAVLKDKYEIPPDVAPTDWGGEVTRESWREWIEKRRVNGF